MGTEPVNVSSESVSTRSTRSSRLRGTSRGVVNYNEDKSDEYLDSVCEDRKSQQSVIGLSTISEVFSLPEQTTGSLDISKEVENEIPEMSFKNQPTQVQHNSNKHTENIGEENDTPLRIPD